MTVADLGRVTYPTAPVPEKLKGTLLDTADVQEGIKYLVTNRTTYTSELFESFNCMKFLSSLDMCQPSTKNFDQVFPFQNGFQFAVYGGVACSTVANDRDNMQSEVERVFMMGESVGVEQAFMANRFAAGPDTDPGAGVSLAWPQPVDINSAGAVKPITAMALLEGHAAANYVGVPTIHVPRALATMLWGVGALQWDGDILRTKMGSKVVAGAGYDYPNTGPDGTAAATGEKWIYATGETVIRSGPVVVKQAIAYSTNTVLVLAERMYVGAVDCYTAAVRVQETA